MGLLKKMLKDNKSQEIPQPPVQTSATYTRAWLGKVAIYSSLEPSQDSEKVDKILSALEKRNGQCPCGGSGPQYRCPCEKIREHGICTCGLFNSVPPRKVHGESVSAIKRNEQ